MENLDKIKEKGVDVVAVVSFNDAWVMSAWGKANGVKGDGIVCLPLTFPSAWPIVCYPEGRAWPSWLTHVML